MEPGDSNGWGEWSKHVLITLERFHKDFQKLNETMVRLESSMGGVAENRRNIEECKKVIENNKASIERLKEHHNSMIVKIERIDLKIAIFSSIAGAVVSIAITAALRLIK